MKNEKQKCAICGREFSDDEIKTYCVEPADVGRDYDTLAICDKCFLKIAVAYPQEWSSKTGTISNCIFM